MAKGAKNWRYMIAYRSNEGNIWDYFFVLSPKKTRGARASCATRASCVPRTSCAPPVQLHFTEGVKGTELSLGTQYLRFCIWQPCISRNL